MTFCLARPGRTQLPCQLRLQDVRATLRWCHTLMPGPQKGVRCIAAVSWHTIPVNRRNPWCKMLKAKTEATARQELCSSSFLIQGPLRNGTKSLDITIGLHFLVTEGNPCPHCGYAYARGVLTCFSHSTWCNQLALARRTGAVGRPVDMTWDVFGMF